MVVEKWQQAWENKNVAKINKNNANMDAYKAINVITMKAIFVQVNKRAKRK